MKNPIMKPVHSYEAEEAFKKGKNILIFDQATKEIIHLNACKNKNFLISAFTRPEYLYYII